RLRIARGRRGRGGRQLRHALAPCVRDGWLKENGPPADGNRVGPHIDEAACGPPCVRPPYVRTPPPPDSMTRRAGRNGATHHVSGRAHERASPSLAVLGPAASGCRTRVPRGRPGGVLDTFPASGERGCGSRIFHA